MLTHNETKAVWLHSWCRVVRPEDVAFFTDTGVDYWNRQLPSLAERGYLKRIQWSRELPGDYYIAYQLWNKGRTLVLNEHHVQKEELRVKRKPIDPLFIDHWIQVTKDKLLLWNSERALFKPLYTIPDVQADVIHDEVRYRFKNTPDGAFTTTPPGYEDLIEFPETDMGSETIYPLSVSGFRFKGNLYRKILVYLAALQRAARAGQPLFRVRFITTSRLRIENIIGALYPRLKEKGGEQFKDFIILNCRDVLQKNPDSWTNFAGEHATLLPEG